MPVICIFNKAHEDEVLRCDNAIICFSANWCVPCKNFAPRYSQIAEEYKNLNFFKVDIDDCQEFTNKFDIKSVPTFIILNKGEKKEEIVGVNENKLLSILQVL
jgi:thioredoxin 1